MADFGFAILEHSRKCWEILENVSAHTPPLLFFAPSTSKFRQKKAKKERSISKLMKKKAENTFSISKFIQKKYQKWKK